MLTHQRQLCGPWVPVIRKKKPVELIEFLTKNISVKFNNFLFKATLLVYFIFSK